MNLITISTCYLYLPSRVWVASGGVVFVGARQLLISRDPALLCRPVLDFNYAYGACFGQSSSLLCMASARCPSLQLSVLCMRLAPLAAPWMPHGPVTAGDNSKTDRHVRCTGIFNVTGNGTLTFQGLQVGNRM